MGFRSSVQDWELLLFTGPKMVLGIIPEEAWSYKKTKKLVLVHRTPNNNQWLVITSHFSVSPAISRFTSKYILFCLQKKLFKITWNIYMAFLYRKNYKKTLHTFKYNFWNAFISFTRISWTGNCFWLLQIWPFPAWSTDYFSNYCFQNMC